MQTLLEQLFPNVMASPDKFWESVWATVVMTGWAGAFSRPAGPACASRSFDSPVSPFS